MLRRTLVGASLAVTAAALIAPGAGVAAAHPKVGPHQFFNGTINGSLGTPTPAIIKVVCPGPAGTTGHPLGGQKVEVNLDVAILANSGYTGNSATSIGVFFGAPPPVAGPGQLSFTKYGAPKNIPTSISVPCSGTGLVYFVPFPQSPPTSRDATVPVEFANIAAKP